MPSDCVRFRSAESLRLSEFRRSYGHIPTREIAKGITSNKNLKTVYVNQGLTIEDKQLIIDAIQSNASIQKLHFTGVDPTKAGFRLCQMKHVKEVEIQRVRTAIPTAAFLQLNRNLQKLRVATGNMGDAAAQAVARLLRVRSCFTSIHFSDSTLTNSGVVTIGQSLQHHSMLTEVIISEDSLVVNNETAAVLAQGIETNTSVHKLHFCVTRLHISGWERIIRALTVNEALKEVHLRHNGLGVEETFEAARLLAESETLEKLHLFGPGFRFALDALDTHELLGTFTLWFMDMNGFRRVCETLVSYNTVTEWAIVDNEITEEVIGLIGRVLSNGSTLKSLIMRNCQIHDDAVMQLRESFSQSQSLDSLDLSYSQIGNSGTSALADFVSSSLIIKRVVLLSNDVIGDDGYVAMGRALERNVSLEALTLTSRRFHPVTLPSRTASVTERGIRALLDGVKVHPVIKVVQLEECFPLHERYQDELDFYLERNKGPKDILHANLPLSVWPLVLKRADDCRLVQNRLRAPDMLHYLVKEKCELFARGRSSRKRKRTSQDLSL